MLSSDVCVLHTYNQCHGARAAGHHPDVDCKNEGENFKRNGSKYHTNQEGRK